MRYRNALVALCLVIFSLQSIAAIKVNSATFDEVQNFGIGKYLLENRRWDIMGSIAHPPLAYYITSIPLLFWHEDKRYWEYENADRNDIVFLGAVDVFRGQGFLSSPENSGDRLLIQTRLMVLLISLLLGWYIYRFSRELYGDDGALAALLIFSFCPNMLAYSGIGTQDMTLAVLWFIASYYFWVFLHKQRPKEAVIAGIWLGMAIATKLTAIVLMPLQVVLYLLYQLKEHKRVSASFIIVFVVSALALCVCYGFNIRPLMQGIELLQIEMSVGQSAFFNGEIATHGWWHFYPAALLLKTPIPVLLLYALSVVYWVRYRRDDWFTGLFLSLPVAAVFLVCSTSNFAVGTRYLLPIYPFMFVASAVLMHAGKVLRTTMYVMICWLVLTTFLVSPHFLAYFNEFIGGPANGYRYMVDSNLDWGQGLKELKRYMDSHGIKRVSLSYFGADSPQRYGIDYDWLPSHHLYNPHPEKPVQISAHQLLAISATNLQGVYLQNPDEFGWLRKMKPVATIGYSIFIYDPAAHAGER